MVSKAVEDETDLLTLLIKRWDKENNTFEELDRVELLKFVMKENNLKA